MKVGNKIAALVLVGAMLVSVVGCQAKVSEKVESDKTQLYVGTYAGGIGDEWLKDAITRFEEKYADTSFEKGKKGVQVIISENNKTTMGGPELLNTIDDTKTEVFFTESVFYYEWVREGKLYDLTDTMTTKLEEYGEDKSIVDKMDQELVDSLTIDGKLYAIPFWSAAYGLVYNATLFDENEWFLAEDGSFTNASGKLGAGPDGQSGTYDDGMPATYDDFFKLCDKIYQDNALPIQWGGAHYDYFSWLLGALFADYEGYDNVMLNYTFDGTADLVKLNTINGQSGTYETEKVQITMENAYELSRQPGILEAMKFAQRLLRGMGTYYDANTALSGSFKQQDSQLAFIRNATTANNKPVAMIIDGGWFENECQVAFEATYGTGATKYDSEFEYKWMPLPKADADKVGTENLYVSPLESYCFLNPNLADNKKELATKFLQFCHTDESMTKFTEITGMMKPYDYEINADNMTTFAKSVVEVARNSRMVYPKANNKLYAFSPTSFWTANLFITEYKSSLTTANIPYPFTLKDGPTGDFEYDYVTLFKGVSSYRRNHLWETFDSVFE